MTEVFVDSSFWLAMLNPGDVLHERANQVVRPPRMITTQAIQLEVMDALSSPRHRDLAIQFWQESNSNPDVVVVLLDEDLESRAVAFFAKHRDKAWSLTDCISFVVMRDRGITDVLTGDHHFEQAGFHVLLKGPS